MGAQIKPMTEDRLSVLIADDHRLLADILALHLGSEGGFLTETAETLPAALDLIAARGGFDVVLLDLRMPGMDGMEGLSRVIAANGGRPVVLLSGNLVPSTAAEAMRLGAASCLPKTLPPRSLINAVRFVASGETYLPMPLLQQDEAEPLSHDTLSPRESLILKDLCAGLTNKEIGRRMSLSEVTIKMHVRSILAKLGAKNRTQAAMIANDRQIV